MGNILLILIAFSSLALSAVAASEYLIQNYDLGQCLSAKNGSPTNAQLVKCNSNDRNQRATIEYDNTREFTVYIKLNDKCLSNYWHLMDDGVQVILWDCWDYPNQRWQTIGESPFFVLKLEQQKKCLSPNDINEESVVQTTCDLDSPRQTWNITIA